MPEVGREITTILRTEASPPFEIARLELRIPNLPSALCGYTAAQISDLHYGPCTSLDHIRKALAIVEKEKPQLLLLTGDYIQVSNTSFRFKGAKRNPRMFHWAQYRRRVRSLAQDLGKLLSSLQLPPTIAAVLGNHDYNEGVGSIKRMFPKSIRWLRNENIVLEHAGKKILLVGLDDTRYGTPDIAMAFRDVPKDIELCLVLAHNPDSVNEPCADLLKSSHLILCGHTHGGQICLPGRRVIVSRTKQHSHISGLSRFGQATLYVNRGLGYGGVPIRIFCPPEILFVRFEKP